MGPNSPFSKASISRPKYKFKQIQQSIAKKSCRNNGEPGGKQWGAPASDIDGPAEFSRYAALDVLARIEFPQQRRDDLWAQFHAFAAVQRIGHCERSKARSDQSADS